jgi:hypothetical protein
LLTNGIIAGNSAPSGDGGGVLMNNDALLDLDNVVIVGNGAGREGGGIFLGDEAVLTGSAVVLAQNAAASGGGVWTDGGTLSLTFSDLWGNIPDDLVGAVDPTGADGNVAVDPQFNDLSAATAAGWDLHLQTGSPLVDAGDPALLDPDGSQQDMGAYGGAAAGDGDLDQDGYRGWWQPGPYDAATYPGQGWDCDDLDPDVFPGAGC